MARMFGRTGIADHFIGIGNESDEFYGYSTSEGRFGDAGGDILDGGGGNDYLAGGSGADFLFGGPDYDTLDGGPGGDVLDGGAGFDTAEYYFSRSAVFINLSLGAGYAGEADGDTFISIEKVIGSAFDDIITGHHDGSTIDGWLGNDRIYGMDRNDKLYGGSGTDRIWGGGGHDSLYGGSEVDYLRGESGADTLDGGDGDDFLWGGWDSDHFVGSRGADMCYGGGATDPGLDFVSYSEASEGVEVNLETGRGSRGLAEGDRYYDIENVIGSGWDDTITGDGRDNRLEGRGGIDVISGRDGNDEIFGGDAADQLAGEGGDDLIYGGQGADQIDGGSHLYGDTISYLDSSTGVGVELTRGIGWLGDAEGDTIVGVEHVEGSRFQDNLIGDGGANNLYGQGGNDTLQGGDQNDRLVGGFGADTLFGGTGADSFTYSNVYDSMYSGTGAPRMFDDIRDFRLSELDVIDLSAIDANPAATAPGDQPFRWMGDRGPSGSAGQLWVQDASEGLNLLGDITGDGVAEFKIHVNGSVSSYSDPIGIIL